jgi:polar amino acid transport system substrate-binding protein
VTSHDPAVLADLTRGGRLRAALNHGNPVLVQRDPASGEPRGVSPELARELAHRLGVELEFVHFDAAGKVFDAIPAGVWDVAFLAIDPARAAGIDFTAPYVIIEGSHLVPEDSPFREIGDLDRPGVRIAVGRNAAYDLYLTRALKHAQLVRAPTSAAAIELFMEEGLDAAAGVRQPLLAFAQAHRGLRVIDGSFTRIEQAMGTPKGRSAGATYMRSFVEEMKANGFIAEALRASGQHDAVVAPPA